VQREIVECLQHPAIRFNRRMAHSKRILDQANARPVQSMTDSLTISNESTSSAANDAPPKFSSVNRLCRSTNSSARDLTLLISWKDAAAAQAYEDASVPNDNARVRRVRIVRDYGKYDRCEKGVSRCSLGLNVCCA
jgi:hypothetical protein